MALARLLILGLILFVAGAAAAQPHPDVQAALKAFGNIDSKVEWHEQVGSYTLVVLKRPGEVDERTPGSYYWERASDGDPNDPLRSRPHNFPLLTVVRDGIPLWYDESDDWRILSVGADGLGKGRPGLIAVSVSHGIVGTGLVAFELGDGFHAYPELDIGYDAAKVVGVQPDGSLTIRVVDSVFRYWNALGGDSPAEHVYITAKDGYWPILIDYMRAAVAGGCSRAEILRDETRCPFKSNWREVVDLADPVQRDEYTGWIRHLVDTEPKLPPALWGVAVRLVYTGHAAEAWRFMREAWPADRPGGDAFIRELVEELRRSDFYEGLLALNGPALEEPLHWQTTRP